MKFPKWKQRQLRAKSELEAAEVAARHKAFWEAVEKPLVEEPSYSESTTFPPLDYDERPPPV